MTDARYRERQKDILHDPDACYFCRMLISKINIKMAICNIVFYDLYEGSSQSLFSVHEYTHAEAMGTRLKPTRLSGGLSISAGGVETGPPGLVS